jgi:hypothetical protein
VVVVVVVVAVVAVATVVVSLSKIQADCNAGALVRASRSN